jgi:type II secretory pathway component PulK
MTGLVMACCVLGLVVVIVWGVFEGERDRVQRARDRQLRREARNVKGAE